MFCDKLQTFWRVFFLFFFKVCTLVFFFHSVVLLYRKVIGAGMCEPVQGLGPHFVLMEITNDHFGRLLLMGKR